MIEISNSRRSVLTWSVLALLMWAVILALFFFSRDGYIWLGTEDKFGENMTSVFYFGAGFLLILRSIRQTRRRETTVWRETLPVLLGLFFIFVGGEEISWGQRLLGIETPEAIRQANVQGEMTLHNLSIFDRGGAILNQHTALNAFVLLMGILLPLAHWKLGWVRKIADKFNFPVIPLACVMWFFLGLLNGQTIAKMDPHWAHAEVKELVFSVGFFLFGVSWFRHGRGDRGK